MAAKKSSSRRLPFGVGCIATLLLLAGLLGAALISALIVDSHFTRINWVHDKEFQLQLQKSGGPGDAAVAGAWVVLAITTAIGLFARKNWAWWVYLLLTLCNIASSVLGYVATRQLPLLGSGILALAIAVYWMRPVVRRSFK